MKLKIVLLSIITFIASFLLISAIYFSESLGESYRIESSSIIMSTIVFSIVVLISTIFLNEMKWSNKLWFIPFSLLGVILATNLSSTELYKSTKLELNLGRLEKFENKYPNSDELNEIKYYMKENNYDAIRRMDKKRFYYLDNTLPIVAEVKKYNNKELQTIFDTAIRDNYINELEEIKIQAKIKEILTERLNASI